MVKKIVKTALILMTLAVLLGGLYFLIQRNQQEPEQFSTESVIEANIIKKAVASGSIVPRREVSIKSRVSGVVEKLHVQPGEIVERGQLLAKITVVPDAVTLNSAQARFETARISENNAKLERDRRRKLYTDKLISKDEYDKYQFEYEIRREELLSAQSNLELIRDGGNGKGGSVSNEVRSTVAGTVLDVPVKEGVSVTETNNFNDGTTIASVADMTDMVFNGTVDESEVGRIQEGMALQISIGAIEDQTFAGVLEFISPKGKNTDGTVQFEIRAALEGGSDVMVRAGYSANADIVLDRRDNVLTLDERALRFSDDGVYVLMRAAPVPGADTQNDSSAGSSQSGSAPQWARRQVEIGLSDGIRAEIIDGLVEGSVVRVP